MITIIASTFKHFSQAGKAAAVSYPKKGRSRSHYIRELNSHCFTKSHWGFEFHSMSVFFVSYIGLNGDRIPHDDDDDLKSSGTI